MLYYIGASGDECDECYCSGYILSRAVTKNTTQEEIDEIMGKKNYPREKFMCKETDLKEDMLDFINKLELTFHNLFIEEYNKSDNNLNDCYLIIYECSEVIQNERWLMSKFKHPIEASKIYEFYFPDGYYYFCNNLLEE